MHDLRHHARSAAPNSMRRLLLLAIAERAAANLVVNTYTTRGEPPPDRIPCMTNADCPTSGSCAANPFCPTDQAGDLESDGQYSCQEPITPGTFGTPSNACDDPSANGFEDCWSDAAQAERGSDEKLKRYCSPRNRDGGMYWEGADIDGGRPPLPPSPPPPPPPPPDPPPDFSNSTEGQLVFSSGALVFILLVGMVRPLPPAPAPRLTRCCTAALPLPSRRPHVALTLLPSPRWPT